MTEEFFRWAGYLANPVRRTSIHVELHPERQKEFCEEYLGLTGVPLLLSGEEAPFYVWPQGVNKWGVQRRVYFFGLQNDMPGAPERVAVRKGRVEGQWRINSKWFIPELWKYGFLIGDNFDQVDRVRQRIPDKNMQHFEEGLSIMAAEERAESLLRKQCESKGMRTVPASEIRTIWDHTHIDADSALKVLKERKIIKENKREQMLTYIPQAGLLAGEVEQEEMRRAISKEPSRDKREYLIETYARDAGWKSLAKEVFGTLCMCKPCSNTFTKDGGEQYIEVHHIVPLYKGGEDHIRNLSVLCDHHHRMAHFARKEDKETIKKFLLKRNSEILKERSKL